MNEKFDYEKAKAVYQAELIFADARGELDTPIAVTMPTDTARDFCMRARYADLEAQAIQERRTGVPKDQIKTAYADLYAKLTTPEREGNYAFTAYEMALLGHALVLGNPAYQIGWFNLTRHEEENTLKDAEGYLALARQFREKGGIVDEGKMQSFHGVTDMLRPWVYPNEG